MTLVVGLASVIVGCGGGGSSPDSSTGPVGDGPVGVVTWVADGDTIEVEVADELIDVRLVALNTPDQGECYADQAQDHLVETLRDHTVRLEIVGEDQFGRTLAHVFDGDRHVNLELVTLGLALASTPGESDAHGEAIPEAEEEAYTSGRGLWAATACGTDGPIPRVVVDPDRSVVDPEGPDDENMGAEMIAIVNDGSQPIDLTGWIVRDESTRHRFTVGGLALDPDETLTIPSSDPGWDPGDSPVWNNDGDIVVLQLPDGTVVARWRY